VLRRGRAFFRVKGLQLSCAFQQKSQNQWPWNSFLTWLDVRLLIITWTDNSITPPVPLFHCFYSSFHLSCLPPPPPTRTHYTSPPNTSLASMKKKKTINNANHDYCNGCNGAGDPVLLCILRTNTHCSWEGPSRIRFQGLQELSNDQSVWVIW